jgi:hypothetical protein
VPAKASIAAAVIRAGAGMTGDAECLGRGDVAGRVVGEQGAAGFGAPPGQGHRDDAGLRFGDAGLAGQHDGAARPATPSAAGRTPGMRSGVGDDGDPRARPGP